MSVRREFPGFARITHPRILQIRTVSFELKLYSQTTNSTVWRLPFNKQTNSTTLGKSSKIRMRTIHMDCQHTGSALRSGGDSQRWTNKHTREAKQCGGTYNQNLNSGGSAVCLLPLTNERCDGSLIMMMIAFITFKSSLVPLFEGL